VNGTGEGDHAAAGTSAEEFATIAEAARRLGVDARQVRRYLLRLSPTDKGQDSQRTHKGHPILLVRVSAVEALRAASAEHETPKDTGNGQSTDRTGHATDTSVGTVVEAAPTAGQLVPLFQRLLSEKDARISELTTALEHEREQSRAWREAHHRAQTLLALSAPVTDVTAQAQDSPPDAPQGPQANETTPEAPEQAGGEQERNIALLNGEAAEAGPGENVVAGDNVSEQQPAPRGSWWQWWGRKTSQ